MQQSHNYVLTIKFEYSKFDNNNSMPLILSLPLAKWLKGFHLIQGEATSNGQCEISYNDQLYFENGYSIGQLLKDILKTKGFTSEALMRVRKIAHISSNQNWRIIKEIMEEIGFAEEIDPHAITLELVQGILQYLYQHFCPKMESRVTVKEKRSYIDPAPFSVNKPLEQSYNLLEFYLLAVSKAFGISLQESLGLLVDNSKYFKKVVIEGTNNSAYEPVINFYKIVTHNMPLINKLIAEEYQSERPFMNNLGLAVLSQNNEVCQIGCIMIDNLQSNIWLEQEGFALLLRSPHEKVLDLLLRRAHPNFALIFNEQITSKFPNKYIQLFTYSKLLKYLHKSIYAKEIFELLPLNHYIKSAFEVFEPDNVKQLPRKLKLMTKNLLKVIVNYFWGKLQYEQKNRICFTFDPQFCESQQQRITTLCFLFQIITELSIREVQFVKKFYRIINKYYSKGTIDIRTFIFNNLVFLYQNHPDHFPIGFFLETYQIANPVQACDYQLIEQLSRNRSLVPQEALMILKICTIYYYQQLQAACFIEPINNILKLYTSVQWASQLAQEILTKWPTLPIPPFQMLPPNTNKIKFRSIGLKKKEMLQFTELNRYKRILKLLTTVKSRSFLMLFGRLITSTISKVEKSKVKEMQNTKAFLNNLLASVDARKIELKEQKAKESIHSRTQALRDQDLSQQLQTDPFLDEYDRRDDHQLNTPIHHLSEENQFIREPIEELNPLLPFTDDEIDDSNNKNHSEDALFQNYEIVYIKNSAAKYEKLLAFVAEKYEKSANMEHFLKILNIHSYFEKDIAILTLAEDRLKLTYEDPTAISFRLIIEMAFRLFEFKKSRRITIKCIQSFLELLVDKSGYQQSSPSPEKDNEVGVKLNAKIDFKHQITSKNIQCNKKSQSYILCFQVVSELLKKAIGVYAVEPISCIISQIMPFNISPSPSKLMKEMQKSRLSEMEEREYDQLQKMIENEPKIEPTRNINYSTPLKKSKIPQIFQSNQNDSKVKASEKWADVQKKVIMRRRQLEGKQKTINDT